MIQPWSKDSSNASFTYYTYLHGCFVLVWELILNSSRLQACDQLKKGLSSHLGYSSLDRVVLVPQDLQQKSQLFLSDTKSYGFERSCLSKSMCHTKHLPISSVYPEPQGLYKIMRSSNFRVNLIAPNDLTRIVARPFEFPNRRASRDPSSLEPSRTGSHNKITPRSDGEPSLLTKKGFSKKLELICHS